MEAFFQPNRCRRIGVWPRGDQVRRTGGISETADSSKQTSQADSAAAPFAPRPLLLDPAGDRLLVALAGPPLGTLQGPAEERAFDRLNPEFGVPADQRSHYGHQAVRNREAALALGVRVAVHDSRQNDPDPVIWQPGQDYRAAEALHAARAQPTRTRHGPERVGPER